MDFKIYAWGPLLFNCKVQKEHLNEVNNLCKKDDKLSNVESLAGHIEHEYSIDSLKLEKILNFYLSKFKDCYKNFYQVQKDFFISNSWVNYMQKGEFNPPHLHESLISGVLFLSIPQEIKKENENFRGSGGYTAGPGELKFIINTTVPYFINQRDFFPQEGDLFIFPGNLMHSVAPFKSNVERISVAFNMSSK